MVVRWGTGKTCEKLARRFAVLFHKILEEFDACTNKATQIAFAVHMSVDAHGTADTIRERIAKAIVDGRVAQAESELQETKRRCQGSLVHEAAGGTGCFSVCLPVID